MRDRKWLRSNAPQGSLHRGPFIHYKVTRGPVYDLTCHACSACLSAKAHVRTPGASSKKQQSEASVDKFTDCLDGRKLRKLNQSQTNRGDCISADHYMSVVPGRLPRTYGREKVGYI